MIIIEKSGESTQTCTETVPTYNKIDDGKTLVLALKKCGADNTATITATAAETTNYTAKLTFSLPYDMMTGEWVASIYDGDALHGVELIRIKDAETEYTENTVTSTLDEYQRIKMN